MKYSKADPHNYDDQQNGITNYFDDPLPTIETWPWTRAAHDSRDNELR